MGRYDRYQAGGRFWEIVIAVGLTVFILLVAGVLR
jgi:hypothetical protein